MLREGSTWSHGVRYEWPATFKVISRLFSHIKLFESEILKKMNHLGWGIKTTWWGNKMT